MKLPSGRTVSNECLEEVADSMVQMHASFGFEDWQDVVTCAGESLAKDAWDGENSYDNEDDRTTILSIVEPVAKEFTNALATVYGLLYAKYVADRDWGGIRGILSDLIQETGRNEDGVGDLLEEHGVTQEELDKYLETGKVKE